MKKIMLSFALIFSVSLGLFAQNTNTPATNPATNPAVTPAATENTNPNAPEIKFEKVIHDYGTITQGSDGTCEFKFTNVGKEPLILNKPQSSCGCTVPTWPQEPILPGKSEVIKVTYATHNIGPINKTITVTSNAKTNRVVLSIKGNVIAKPADKVPEKNVDQSAAPINK